MTESSILFESANFYCVKVGGKIEIRLNQNTHSVVVGTKDNLEAAKSFILKCEKYPKNVYLLAGK